MDDDLPRFEQSLVMIVLSGGLQQRLDELSISPELFLRFIQNQQRYVAAPFEKLRDVSLRFDLHFMEAVWPLDGNWGNKVVEAIRAFLAAIESCVSFNRWATAEGLPQCQLHAGIDIGQLIVDERTRMGEVITAAANFAEVARKQKIPLVVAGECYEQFQSRLKKPLKRKSIEVPAVVRRKREIIQLSLNDAESLIAASI